MKKIIGKKIGMTRIFDKEGKTIPISIVEAGPCIVTQIKTIDTDGYVAIQVGYGETKKVNKPVAGHLKKSGVKGGFQRIQEFRMSDEEMNNLKIGDQVNIEGFQSGDEVKVSGFSKGKGFQGTVTRHHFHTGPRTHGSNNYRQPGSIGATFPQRVIKGRRMAGHMGAENITTSGLSIIDVNKEKKLILIKGAIPGYNGSIVVIEG